MADNPMNEILKNIDKQMEEKGIIAKDHVPVNFANSNPNFPRVENSENTFRSTVSNGEIPYYKKKKIKKLNDLDKYLIFAFSNLIIYTIAAMVIFAITHEEPVVLTGCFFAAFGGEILACARIKKLKLHKEAEIKGDQNNYG